MNPQRARMRLLLDNNIWSAIAREESGTALNKLVERHDCELVVPPSVLLEVLKTPQRQTRDPIVRLLATGPRRRRLRTEAHLQSLEYVDVFRRRRPEVMRSRPDTGSIAKYESFWLKRNYRYAIEESDRSFEVTMRMEPVIEEVMRNQLSNRRHFVDSGLMQSSLTALKLFVPEPEVTLDWGGWNGEPVDAWRLMIRDQLKDDLFNVNLRAVRGEPTNTFADWVGAYVDLNRLAQDPSGFSRLWLQEVQPREVVRSWLRRTLEVVQLRRKVSHGNPVDNQHAAYLPDCDLFLTRDRAFADVLSEVAAAAPSTCGRVGLLRHDTSARVVDVLDRELKALSAIRPS